MSHVDQGPLSAYNSLADSHLSGYFTNSRMRKHLRKAGLVNKHGEIVTENTYRLNMSRREHKQHVKDMLAQAIVHKTLDLERTRQAEIRRKLEEIAKIELVRRVRASRQRKREVDILPYISPRSSSSRPASGVESTITERRSFSHTQRSSKGKSRPISDPPKSRKQRPMSALSSNYDDDEEGAVVYLDDEGRPITPAHVDESPMRYTSRDPIDTRHLYSLDTAALRKYATLMAKMEQGRGGTSPYLIPQVPLPPKSPRSSRATSARPTPRSAQRHRGDAAKSASPKRPSTANQAYLHPASGAQKFKGQQESLCQVLMVYHGSSLSLAREMLPGRCKQEVVVEQQHCGGNTLTVFKDDLERGAQFSFLSYRHRGYPFSLSIYIDGKMDCRVSTCCEYRHQKGGRIGGKKGHFSISGIQGAVPCYKCQVEKGIRVGAQAPRPKLKRPPEHQEEVVVVESARKPDSPEPEPETADKYDDDDFESSDKSSSSAEEEGGLELFQPKDARGVEKTTGKVDINELTSDEESDRASHQKTRKTRIKSAGKRGQAKRSSGSSSSSSSSSRSSSSERETEDTRKAVAEKKVLVPVRLEQPKDDVKPQPTSEPSPPDASKGDKPKNSGMAQGVDEDERKLDVFSASTLPALATEYKTAESNEPQRNRHNSGASNRSSSSAVSSSSSSGSASILDKGPNTANDPTAEVEDSVPQSHETPVVQGIEVETDLKDGASQLDTYKKKEESDSDSEDSSSSDSDNGNKESDGKLDGGDRTEVIAILASEQQAGKKTEEREMGSEKEVEVKERENQEKPQEMEKSEPPKKFDMDFERERKIMPVPAVTVSNHTSTDGGASSGSSSDSSDSDEENGSDTKKTDSAFKSGVIQTEVDVHNSEGKQSATSHDADSDLEATHGGHDPDNVADRDRLDAPIQGPPAAFLPQVQPGSISPLLEKSKSMIEIKGITLNKSQLYECADHLTNQSRISQLNLVNCGLDDDDIQKVVEALKTSPSNPVLLNLSLNPLSSGCVDYILDLLETKPSIEAILLQGTRLGDSGVEHLVDGLLRQHMRKKDDRGSSTESLKELRELDLSDCKMGDDGAKAVARLLSSDMEVDTLTLSSNQAISEHGWSVIGDALSYNTTLETLTLDHNLLGDPGVKAIAAGLQNNSSVTALDLNGVGVMQTGGQALVDLLKRNTTLLEITLAENNRLDKGMLEDIGKYISLNKTMGGSQSQSQ